MIGNIILGIITGVGIILLIAYLMYLIFRKPKWEEIYETTNDYLIYLDVNDPQSAPYMDCLAKVIAGDFDLSEEEGWECIKNWKDKYWFKQKFDKL